MKAPNEMGDTQMVGPGAPRTWLMGSEAFERTMPHHAGIRALWETKWKFPVRGASRPCLERWC